MTWEDHAEDVRVRVAKTVIHAARAAQSRIRKLSANRFWLPADGVETNLERTSIDNLFDLAETQMLDLVTIAAVLRERLRELRHSISAEGVWTARLQAKPRPMMAGVPALGAQRQYVTESRYVDIERVTAYVFELRMGELDAKGDYGSGGVVRRRIQGWARTKRVTAAWLETGTVIDGRPDYDRRASGGTRWPKGAAS